MGTLSQVQYQNITGHDIAQFKDMSQVVVAPPEYASGEVIYPTKGRSSSAIGQAATMHEFPDDPG